MSAHIKAWVVRYGEDGTLQEIQLESASGAPILRRVYSPLREDRDGLVHLVEFKRRGGDAPLALLSRGGSAKDRPGAEEHAEITAQRVRYDEQGRVRTVTFLNAYHQERANPAGVMGRRFTYADGPRPVREEGSVMS